MAYHFCNYVQNYVQHLAVMVNSIYRGNYWARQWGFRQNSSTADHTYSFRQTLEKMGIQRSSASTILVL